MYDGQPDPEGEHWFNYLIGSSEFVEALCVQGQGLTARILPHTQAMPSFRMT